MTLVHFVYPDPLSVYRMTDTRDDDLEDDDDGALEPAPDDHADDPDEDNGNEPDDTGREGSPG